MRRSWMADGAGDIARLLIKFSLPLIGSGILQQLYSWADAFIVGNIEGEAALAAVGATTAVVNFYVTAITGFTLGLSILFAQKFGQSATGELAKILSTFSAVLGGVFLLLAGVGMWTAGPLLRFLQTTPDTLHLAEDYLQAVSPGLPFLAVYNVYGAALRGIGDSRAPFYAVCISSAVNILLDILFVAALGWGVTGAAVATVVSQAAMAAFLWIYAAKKYSILRLRPGEGLVDRAALAQGCRLGIPPMVQASVSSAGSLVLQNFMNGFGTQTVAAVTTAYRVDSVVMVPILNLGSGVSTLVAQSCGAGEESRGRKIGMVGAVLMAGVSLALTGCVILAGEGLIAMFGAGEEAIRIGGEFFRTIAGFYLVYGIATVLRSYLEGMGDVLYSSVAGIASLALRILASYAMAALLGNLVIAYAEGLSWVALLALYAARMAWKKRRGRAPHR